MTIRVQRNVGVNLLATLSLFLFNKSLVVLMFCLSSCDREEERKVEPSFAKMKRKKMKERVFCSFPCFPILSPSSSFFLRFQDLEPFSPQIHGYLL